MSNETAKALDDAKAEQARLQAEADRLKLECLARVARGIPAKMEEIAKKTALSQPEVAKQLGAEGLRQLRADLAEQATAVAAELEGAVEQIKWPTSGMPDSIHRALFDFLNGKRVDGLAAVLTRYGFTTDDRWGDGKIKVFPQALYQRDDVKDIADALRELTKASKAVSAAEQADDEDTVGAMWG